MDWVLLPEEMLGVILTVLLIAIFVIGLPLLVVVLKDRPGGVGLVIRKALGAVSLVLGVFIIGWVLYNLFWPTEEFDGDFTAIFQLGFPLAMVGFGWYWLTSKAGAPEEDAQEGPPE